MQFTLIFNNMNTNTNPNAIHNPINESIDSLHSNLLKGSLSYAKLLQDCFEASKLPSAANVFTKRYQETATAAALHADALIKAGVTPPLLMGLPITIKDLYDVAGETTHSASLVLKGAQPAAKDAEIVKRLRQAGMAVMGKTNMSEFAFSGVGINPHWGTPQNPHDPQNHRIPGGSSSGAAVSVALGLSVAAIGSDTGGSIRIPAALCGLVGFKSSMFRVPTEGALELSRSLDTVCAMTKSVKDCLHIDAVLSGAYLDVKPKGVRALRLAVSKTLMQDELTPPVAQAFERCLTDLSARGAESIEIDLKELAEIGQINVPGGLSPIEYYAAYSVFVENDATRMDHRVRQRMLLGKGVGAREYIALLDARKSWIHKMQGILRPFDALISPTVPLQAPVVQGLLDSDDEFFRVNRLLLRNTFAINFLDGCSFSIPIQKPNELPIGLMLSHCNAWDANLAGVALAVEAALHQR